MSSYRKIETKFNDRDTLEKALREVCEARGIPFEAAQVGETITAYGWNNAKLDADFVVRKRDIGDPYEDLAFQAQDDGTFRVMVGTHYRGSIVNEIKQSYAKHQVSKLARARGMRVEEKREGGIVRLRLVGRVKSQNRVGVRIR
jgi:hypothetical protein